MKNNKFDISTCPKCGNKMQINTNISLLSNPIQYQVWCKICGYKEYVNTRDSTGDNNENKR